ncbi:ADP-ribosylation factor-directed GTPase activating protein isoform b [Planctomycetota bacterium]
MNIHHQTSRLIVAACCCGALVLNMGCGSRSPSETVVNANEQETPGVSKTLQQKIDAALDYTFYERELNTAEHGAWQVLHGALAYQRQFPVRVGNTESTQSAISYLLDGGTVDGWQFRPGQKLDNGRIGLRAVMQPGTKRGQGHADQWLAILAQCEFPIEKEIITGGRKYTIGDLIAQVQLDVPNNIEVEYSWTLIGLALYLEPDTTWTANDGEEWSIPGLIEIELQQDLNESACGGTHRLIGVTMALNEYKKKGGELKGIWATADTRIRNAIRIAQQTQNEDGSFSPNYFARPGQTVDTATRLATTGHILEFLSLAMAKSELETEWVRNAAEHLSELFLDTEEISLECGALYHAAHGLALYRDLVYGKRIYN